MSALMCKKAVGLPISCSLKAYSDPVVSMKWLNTGATVIMMVRGEIRLNFN